jgi:hypothetical protein
MHLDVVAKRKNNIKMNLKYIGSECTGWIHLGLGFNCGLCEHVNGSLGSIKKQGIS